MWCAPLMLLLFHNLVNACCALHATVVRLCSQLQLKKESPLIFDNRVYEPGRQRESSAVVSSLRADQASEASRVSLFKEPRASRPSPPTPPPRHRGASWASSSRIQHRRRQKAQASNMAEPSQSQTTEASATETSALASITTSPFPSSDLASTSPSSEGTPTSRSPSGTPSGSSSNPTSRQASTTATGSDTFTSTGDGVSTGAASTATSSRPTESSTHLSNSSTASESSSSRSLSTSGDTVSSSAAPSSRPSQSISLTSPPPSSPSTTSRSSVMSASQSSLSLSAPRPSDSSSASLSSTPLSSSTGSITTISSTTESSATISSSGSFSRSTSSSASSVASISSTRDASSSSSTLSPSPALTVTPIVVVTFTTMTTNAPVGSSTGVLRPGELTSTGFANNTGAIIGVSVTAAVVLLALAFFIFFFCRGYRSRRSPNESTNRILALARNASWRKPVDGSDDGSFHEKVFYNDKRGSVSPPRNGSHDHSSDGHKDGLGSVSYGHGLTEYPDYPAMQRPMNPTFGGQPYMPTYDIPRRPVPSVHPVQDHIFATVPNSNPFKHEDDPDSSERGRGPTRSETILALPGWSSPSEHGVITAYSATTDSWSRGPAQNTPRTRNSISGPRPMPGTTQKTRRHSSTPPSAFMGSRDDALDDHDRESATHDSQGDRRSIKSIMSLFKSARRTSMHSTTSTIKGSSFSRLGDHEEPVPALPKVKKGPAVFSPNIYSPSLLNPPIELPPQPLLSFPRGVTGHSYNPRQSLVLWPPATLPPASPSPTDDSSMIEGLLHPKLRLEGSRQASQTSLRDNEDYSRPISGLIKNRHLRSTTSIGTGDTAGSEDGVSVHERGPSHLST